MRQNIHKSAPSTGSGNPIRIVLKIKVGTNGGTNQNSIQGEAGGPLIGGDNFL
jgi:hypothetical protein